jgi:hypothetical protein
MLNVQSPVLYASIKLVKWFCVFFSVSSSFVSFLPSVIFFCFFRFLLHLFDKKYEIKKTIEEKELKSK